MSNKGIFHFRLLGISLLNLKQYEEANDCYSMAIDRNPNISNFWFHKGIFHSIILGKALYGLNKY